MEKLTKELRGKILSFLDYVSPEAVDQQSLIKTLFEYHPVDDIEKSIDYLCGKGLVDKKETPHPFRKREKIVTYKITPEGIDLIEGSTEDPGIVIVEW